MQDRSSKSILKLDWASYESAKYACKNWHYSKSVPPPPHNIIGVWERGKFKGVVIYGRGASSNLFKPYGLESDMGCELVRVALDKHETEVSRILAISFKLLKKRNPKLKLIVSFADPEQDHHGGIYQASNWYYLGTSAPSKKYIAPNGKELHGRQVSEKGYNKQYGNIRKTFKPSECKVINVKGKHRYLMPLTKEMKEFCELNKKEYPKRGEHESNAF